MPTGFEAAQAALIRRMKSKAGRPVTYTRGAETATLTAWQGNTLYSVATKEPGANVVRGERDYLFATADLVIGGATVLPQKGDRITDTEPDGTPVTFELQTPTKEPVWRFSDQTRMVVRVHCKRVKET